MSSHASNFFLLRSSDSHIIGRNNWKSMARSDELIAAPDSFLNFCSTIWYSLFIAYAIVSSFTLFLMNFPNCSKNADHLSSSLFQNFFLSNELRKSSTTPDLINASVYVVNQSTHCAPSVFSSYIISYIISAVAITSLSDDVHAFSFNVLIDCVIGVNAFAYPVVSTTSPCCASWNHVGCDGSQNPAPYFLP